MGACSEAELKFAVITSHLLIKLKVRRIFKLMCEGVEAHVAMSRSKIRCWELLSRIHDFKLASPSWEDCSCIAHVVLVTWWSWCAVKLALGTGSYVPLKLSPSFCLAFLICLCCRTSWGHLRSKLEAVQLSLLLVILCFLLLKYWLQALSPGRSVPFPRCCEAC